MRDVSDVLVGPDQRLDRASVRRVVAAMAELHLTFWGERFPELCGLEDRYLLFSPQTARREAALSGARRWHRVGGCVGPATGGGSGLRSAPPGRGR